MKKMWEDFKEEKVNFITKIIVIFALIFTCILFLESRLSVINIFLAILGIMALVLRGYKYINTIMIIMIFITFLR